MSAKLDRDIASVIASPGIGEDAEGRFWFPSLRRECILVLESDDDTPTPSKSQAAAWASFVERESSVGAELLSNLHLDYARRRSAIDTADQNEPHWVGDDPRWPEVAASTDIAALLDSVELVLAADAEPGALTFYIDCPWYYMALEVEVEAWHVTRIG